MIKQTNGRDNAMIHRYQVYNFPKGKLSKIYMTKFVLAGSQLRWSMITKIIEGKDGISDREFNRHFENSNVDEDHDTLCRVYSEDAIK